MPKIILTRGIQGSGKSTWAKKWVEEDPTHRVRWNNDDFRRMLGPYWIPERESFVSKLKLDFLSEAMFFGYDIVIDDMNLNFWNWRVVQIKIKDFNRSDYFSKSKKIVTLLSLRTSLMYHWKNVLNEILKEKILLVKKSLSTHIISVKM